MQASVRDDGQLIEITNDRFSDDEIAELEDILTSIEEKLVEASNASSEQAAEIRVEISALRHDLPAIGRKTFWAALMFVVLKLSTALLAPEQSEQFIVNVQQDINLIVVVDQKVIEKTA